MPLSEKRLKAFIENELEKKKMKENERGHETPVEAAKALMEKTDHFLEEARSELNTAGKVMRPGLKKAFENYVNKKLRDL